MLQFSLVFISRAVISGQMVFAWFSGDPVVGIHTGIRRKKVRK
jgi:hypothetical protein